MMLINKYVFNVVGLIPRHIFLVPLLLMSVGCAGVSDLFNNDIKVDSKPVAQSSSMNFTTDMEQDAQSSSKDMDSKKDEASESNTIVSVSPLWDSYVGDDTRDEAFSAQDLVDDLIRLSYPMGKGTGATALAPVFYNDAIYAASAGGELTRFDPVTGNVVWGIDTQNRLSGGVGVSEEMLLVATFKGKILAYDKKGNLLWESQVTSEVLSPPQIDNGVVVVRTGEGRIFGLDATNGKRKWVYQGFSPSLTVRSFAGVLVKGGAVFAGFAGGKLVALNLSNGKVGWEVVVSKPRGVTELERITDITSLPVADERQICAVAYRGRISCFQVSNGAQIWTRDVSSSAGLAMDNKNIYVSEDDGSVVAYDKNNGTIIWKKNIPKKEIKMFANFTYVDPSGDRGGTVATEGSEKDSNLWDFLKGKDWTSGDNKEDDWEKSDRPDIRMKGGGWFGDYVVSAGSGSGSEGVISNKLSAPFVYGAQVVVGDSQGYVTVLKNNDGAIVSQSETDGGAILTRPERVPNGLVVQTINGGLYAFSMQ